MKFDFFLSINKNIIGHPKRKLEIVDTISLCILVNQKSSAFVVYYLNSFQSIILYFMKGVCAICINQLKKLFLVIILFHFKRLCLQLQYLEELFGIHLTRMKTFLFIDYYRNDGSVYSSGTIVSSRVFGYTIWFAACSYECSSVVNFVVN